MEDGRFFDKAQTGTEVEIDLEHNILTVDGEEFSFELSDMEKNLTRMGGLTKAFGQFGKGIYSSLMGGAGAGTGVARKLKAQQSPAKDVMAW